MTDGKFGTAVNCMDGRVQEPVAQWMKKTFNLDYVDMITEPGPIAILNSDNPSAIRSILYRISVSVQKHNSSIIVIAGHHDCAGNPVPRSIQELQIIKSLEIVSKLYKHMKIIGIYITESCEPVIIKEISEN